MSQIATQHDTDLSNDAPRRLNEFTNPVDLEDSIQDIVDDAAATKDLRHLCEYIDSRATADRIEVVLKLTDLIRHHRNPSLTIDCILYVCDFEKLNLLTQEHIAHRHNRSKSAVCQRIKTICTELKLYNPNTKSTAGKKEYSRIKKERPTKCASINSIKSQTL